MSETVEITVSDEQLKRLRATVAEEQEIDEERLSALSKLGGRRRDEGWLQATGVGDDAVAALVKRLALQAVDE